MALTKGKEQLLLFLRLFVVLFIILFIMPQVLDGILKILMIHQPPSGSSILVSKNLYENMDFIHKYLIILKNIIFSL
jgi:hypothetical protein